jgi:hypothetical protein
MLQIARFDIGARNMPKPPGIASTTDAMAVIRREIVEGKTRPT